MKRIMRSGLALVLTLGVLCLNVCGINVDDTALRGDDSVSVTTEEMKAFLIDRNYPSDYLDTLILPQLENLYHMATEKNAYFYSRETRSLSETREDEIGTAESRGNIPAEDMDFSITMSYTPIVLNGSTYFKEIFVTIEYNWIDLPMMRGIDAITANWDTTLLKYGGDENFIAYDYMQNPLTGRWQVWKTWTKPNALNQGGLGIDTYIDSGDYLDYSWLKATGLKGTVDFSLLPETMLSMKINPLSVTNINADYTHDKNPLGTGLSFTYQGVSVLVAPGVLQDSIATSDTLWYTYVE